MLPCLDCAQRGLLRGAALRKKLLFPFRCCPLVGLSVGLVFSLPSGPRMFPDPCYVWLGCTAVGGSVP